MTSALRSDVAIIGAGPAGSTLAALLAMKGVSVVLIDRDRFPRDKLCGEFLSWDALPIVELLGLSATLNDVGAASISRCRIVSSRTYEFDFPASARGVSRMLLDRTLFERAVSLGAERRDGWSAVKIDRRADTWTIEVSDGESSGRVEAKVVAGAWGRWGRFDLQLGRAFVRADHRHFGFKRHYRRTNESSQNDSIALYSFRRGYLGVSDVEGGLTNICGLVHQSRMQGMKGGWDGFIGELRRESPALERLFESYEPAQRGFLSSEPVIFRAKSPVSGGIFMVGDAAGIMDPLTGNGMAMAMQSALLCAPEILARLSSDSPAGAEEHYAWRYQDFFRSRLRWSRTAASLLSRPGVISSAARLVRTPSLGRTFLEHTRARAGAIERMTSRWMTSV